jgi:phage tail-like protein
MTRTDPVLASNFTISLMDSTSGLGAVAKVFLSAVHTYPLAGFSECNGLEMTLDVQEYMQGGGNDTVLKFPTRFKPANIVLKKGLTTGTDLWDWFYAFVQGVGRRRDGIITVQDGAGNQVQQWGFRRGLPLKYSGPQLVAAQSNVAIETLEIAHEGLYLVGGNSSLAQKISQAANAIAGLAD